MRILFVLFIALLGIQTQSTAQVEANQRVYLKDGSFLLGKVMETTDEQISFQTTYGAIYNIPQESIARIEQSKSSRTYFNKGKGVHTTGIYGAFDFALLFGQGFDNPWDDIPSVRVGLTASMGAGYQFTQYFGLGLDLDFTAFRNHLIACPSLEVRSYLHEGPVSPYVRLQGGYGFDLVGNPTPFDFFYTAGPMVHPSVGLRFASRSSSEFHIDMGYRFQHLTTEDVWFTDKEVFRRLSLRCGVVF
ncbi:MAG: hypothetical protein KDC34_13455 [Saprospiraceae bacterium]|nr:hypothetical protein [Saprospiraceae bacterium]